MAPALIQTPADQLADEQWRKDKQQGDGYKEAYQQGAKQTNYEGELNGTDGFAPAAYPNYLPYWDDVTYPPYEEFEHTEHGKDADPSFPNLLANATVKDLTGNIGAEVTGVQLSKLTNAGKDELARFVAERKVVAFRNQDLADLPIQEALDFAEYFGPSHIHPASGKWSRNEIINRSDSYFNTSGAPKGFPGVHLVHRSAKDTTVHDYFQERTNSITWHTDVSYELQPPGVFKEVFRAVVYGANADCIKGTTFLYLLDGPTAGGDTIFANLNVSSLKVLLPLVLKFQGGI